MTGTNQSRDFMADQLRKELIGPDPRGIELDVSNPVIFSDKKDSYKSFVQKGTGEEILQRDSPTTRYGAAALHPQPPEENKKKNKDDYDPVKKIIFGDDGEILLKETRDGTADRRETIFGNDSIGDDDLFDEEDSSRLLNWDVPDLSSANKPLPNSMAVTFQAEILPKGQVIVNFNAGRYHEFPVKIGSEKRTWWAREAVEINAKFNDIESVYKPSRIKASKVNTKNTANLDPTIEVYARPTDKPNLYTITVIAANRTKVPAGKMPDAFALFQSELSVRVISPAGNRHILPYRAEDGSLSRLSEEEQTIAMLYRRAKTYAVGHGCAADWDREVATDEKVKIVTANHLPAFEIPLMTSEIKGADGKPLEISMAKLAGRVPDNDGIGDLGEMLDEYSGWINRREKQIAELPVKYHLTAFRHIEQCRIALERMSEGWQLVKTDEQVRKAFQLANNAMLMQQLWSKQPLRHTEISLKNNQPVFSRKYEDSDLFALHPHSGKWRAFQIGFLLMALRSAIDPDCPERETVDLIWFPTGGGKTEAYLLLIALTIFHRRLVDPLDAGTTAFMRYTLRLLTAQQFQRAGALICAAETIRRQMPNELGETPISLGLWLGNDVTPGTRHDARRSLLQLQKHPLTAVNKFILNRCPHCAAEIGKVGHEIKKLSSVKNGHSPQTKQIGVAGYKLEAGVVILHCPDSACPFHDRLPIYVTDEQIYKLRPTMFIATVDKFAALTWKPEAKTLFGLDKDGERVLSPPALKLIDEFHLLSGPLGTMIGLYEAVVDELCTDRRTEGKIIKPKIVASTATTRAYAEQSKALFARADARLFPPPGLDADNSFFARRARDKEGKPLPGRLYVGVHAPGLKSVQNTEVRVYTALLQAASELPPSERNWYWTLMVFFNNLKWLGNSYSLFQANLPVYSLAYQSRTQREKSRRVKTPLELTGQLNGDEVLAALKRLEIDWTDACNRAVDCCFCSSLAEVGVDVGRLSLMAVDGQPKTTAQYIQITSRVGRDPNHPGLVVTIFSPWNTRDRSHYERFRSYHERLYAQVEPVSLTPFSPPALERGLHSVICALVRQTGTRRESATPFPVPEQKIKLIRDLLLARVQVVAPDMRAEFEKIFDRRVSEWRRWEQRSWSPDPRMGETGGLLRSFDRWVEESEKQRSWATPVSMRNVDAESEIRITHYYQSIKNDNKNLEASNL